MVFTRSSFPGVGKYAGHWLGDNAANWNDIKWAIPGMLEFNLFGIPYIGADICGFFDDSPEELCRRWMQVGAFYPFSRNHNAQNYKPQDPAWYGDDSLLVNTSKHYLNIRYSLLPYLYTLFYNAHVNGATVVRPVMHEFFSDNATWKVDRQFMWGAHLLITPVLDPGVTTVSAYIPDAIWYDFETEEKITARKEQIDMNLPADKLGLHLRGGAILPVQRPDVTTTYSRRHPMGLIVALDDNSQASGELFWDDGESRDSVSGSHIRYQFSVVDDVLSMHVAHNGYTDPNNLKFENITIMGIIESPTAVFVIEGDVSTPLTESQIHYDQNKQVMHLRNLQLDVGKEYKVTWVSGAERINCYPEENSSMEKCKARGCIWKTSAIPNAPSCYYPAAYGYKASKVTDTSSGWTIDLERNTDYPPQRPQSPDINKLRVEITYLSGHSLRWKIFDADKKRYEVPVHLTLPSTPETDEGKRLYRVQINQEPPFGIQVIRKDTGETIWDSSLPGFTFSDFFIEISTRLPSNYIYGLGETEHGSYKHDLNFHTYGLFAKDQPPGEKLNSYGVHPFYMGLEKSKNAHGVLLLNSNAMDVTLQPTPALTYRTIGGILDFYMVLGPTPELVVQQYTEIIGRPVLPAYWTLGFQLCRYGYANDREIESLYNEMKAAQIPYDVQYADIDYMERQMDFTLDKDDFQGLPALVDKMRAEGMRFIFILDPAIAANETEDYPAFTRGVQQDVFIKWPPALSSEIVWGKVWPDYPDVIVDDSLDWDTQVQLYRAYVAFPDFFRNRTATWWHNEIKEFYDKIMKFDGIWIDMNEPASFVHGTVGEKCLGEDILENPPYMPPLESKERGLNHKTICMNSEQILPDGTPVKHYDVHNLYGWSHTKPTYDAVLDVTGKRGIVVTRSTYPTSGQWAGHWLGDNYSGWDQLLKSIVGMMEFSIFGMSYTGADICGFFNPAEYQMCLRWMQLGAFYPYSRNHNSIKNPRQDPVAWDDAFKTASRDVLNIRYTLLPYLYTLMYEAHVHGNTVIRPVLHEFNTDENTWAIDRQFLWGPALLITPVLDQGATMVKGYVPNARWYDYYTGQVVGVRGQFLNMDAPLDKINLHVRGGYILPCQKPESNTKHSRKNPLGLLAALDDNGSAKGSLFWDDGEGIDTVKKGQILLMSFAVSQKSLSGKIDKNGLIAADRLTLGDVKVWGPGTAAITKVTLKVNGNPDVDLKFNIPETEVLEITVSTENILLEKEFTITWT